jgi:membrane-associated phospholipid phosphatase
MSLYQFMMSTVILVLVLTSMNLHAQQDSSVSSILANDAGIIWRDARSIFLAPLHFQKTEWLVASSVIGGTAALFSIDESARSLAMRNQSPFGDHFFEIGKQYGGSVNAVIFAGGVYAGGLLMRNTDVRLTGLMTFESLLFAGGITTVAKTLFGRSRPFNDEGAFKYYGPQFNDNHFSLPSGHSTVAFSVSSVLAERIKNVYASIALYSLASITVFSRVYHDEHWFSDTFLGAAIGTATGLAVVHLHEDQHDHASLRLIPTLNGLRAEVSF